MTLPTGSPYGLIIGAEVAFWVVLFSGLACRYLLRWRRVSALLLWCVPLIDLTLLALTVMDLRAGTAATFAHGLSAAYLGFTVAFGPAIIGWADRAFAHRFAGGPPPPAPLFGWAAVRYDLKLWGLCIVAVCITYVLLAAMIGFVEQRAD